MEEIDGGERVCSQGEFAVEVVLDVDVDRLGVGHDQRFCPR